MATEKLIYGTNAAHAGGCRNHSQIVRRAPSGDAPGARVVTAEFWRDCGRFFAVAENPAEPHSRAAAVLPTGDGRACAARGVSAECCWIADSEVFMLANLRHLDGYGKESRVLDETADWWNRFSRPCATRRCWKNVDPAQQPACPAGAHGQYSILQA